MAMMEVTGSATKLITILSVLGALWTVVVTSNQDRRYRPLPEQTWRREPRDGIDCLLFDQSSCGDGHCCVKEVISFQDVDKNPVAKTRCDPHRQEGQLCLRYPEGYLCPCAEHLICIFTHNETYGHCGVG